VLLVCLSMVLSLMVAHVCVQCPPVLVSYSIPFRFSLFSVGLGRVISLVSISAVQSFCIWVDVVAYFLYLLADRVLFGRVRVIGFGGLGVSPSFPAGGDSVGYVVTRRSLVCCWFSWGYALKLSFA